MFEKLEELAKNNKKISDFHIRSGSPLAYRQTGEIYKVKEVVDNGKTKVIFLTLPNNPTGNLFSEDTIRSLLDLGVMVVVDEAYYEFSKTTVINLVPDYANLIVLRTFSKWAGLASLRIGYGLMPPAIVNWIMTIKPPYNINAAAELGLLASLDDIDYLKTNVQFIIGERDRVAEQLSLSLIHI